MAVIGKNRPVFGRSANGGLTAPPGAGKGNTTGLGNAQRPVNPVGQNQVVPRPIQGGARNVGGKPAAPGAPQKPAMPWDLAAANQEAGAQKQLANTTTGLDANWLRTQQAFGLEGQWADAASNPYSRASALQRSFDSARRGVTNSAGQGLYSGSFINAQNENTHQFNLGRDQLQKEYDQANAEYVGGKQNANDEYLEAINNAMWQRVNTGLQAPPEPAPAGKKVQKKPTKPVKVGGGRKVR